MNVQNLFDDIDFLIGTNSTNYTATNKYACLNRWYKKMWAEILKAAGEWEIQETNTTATLTANVGQYCLGATPLTITRVEVGYDLATAANSGWVQALPIDRNEINFTDVTLSSDIAKSFSPGKPYYDLYDYGGSAYLDLYPVPFSASTGGLKYWYNADLALFSGTAQTPVFADPFHRILSLGAAYDWAGVRGMKEAAYLKSELNDLMRECIDYYSTRQKDRTYSFLCGKDYNEYN